MSTWLPETTLQKIGVEVEKKDLAFTMANGERITRSVGFAVIRIAKYFTIDEVVFGEPGDMTLLGARSNRKGCRSWLIHKKKKLVAARTASRRFRCGYGCKEALHQKS